MFEFTNFPEINRTFSLFLFFLIPVVFALFYKKESLFHISFFFAYMTLQILLCLGIAYYHSGIFILGFVIIGLCYLFFQGKYINEELSSYYLSLLCVSIFSVPFLISIFLPLLYPYYDAGRDQIITIPFLVFFVLPVLFSIFFKEAVKIEKENKDESAIFYSFSFTTAIYVPLTVLLMLNVLDIDFSKRIKEKVLTEEQVVYKLVLPKDTVLTHLKNDLSYILGFKFNQSKLEWHNMPLESIGIVKSYGIHYDEYDEQESWYRLLNESDILEGLIVYSKENYFINDVFCEKSKPIMFKFLSSHHQDWSESNTMFLSCEFKE